MSYKVITKGPVTIRRYRLHTSFEALDEFLPEIERFAIKMGYTYVDLYNPHGEIFSAPEAPTDGCAFVFWSLPVEYRRFGEYVKRKISSLYGHRLVLGAGDTLQPSAEEIPGYIYLYDAEVVSAVLDVARHIYFITNDLVHHASGLPAFREILERIVEEREAPHLLITKEGDTSHAFARSLATSAIEKLKAHLSQIVDGAETEYLKAEGALKVTIEEEKISQTRRRFAAREIQQALTIPGVERITIHSDRLAIYTYPIIMPDVEKPGNYRVLGRYRIDVFNDTRIYVINLDLNTTKRGRRAIEHHPYSTSADGGICLGNASGIINQAARRFDLHTLVVMMLRLLRDPSDNSRGFRASLKRFPLVSEAQLTRAFPKIDIKTLWPRVE